MGQKSKELTALTPDANLASLGGCYLSVQKGTKVDREGLKKALGKKAKALEDQVRTEADAAG